MNLNVEQLGLLLFVPVALAIYLIDQYFTSNDKQESMMKACFLSCIVSAAIAVYLTR